ncbi:MAG: hypothetical protein EOM05_05425 [Clostridia bacterium]|nr:hypothetical protein [Clostridia bacterium]
MDKGIRCHFSSIIAKTVKTFGILIVFVALNLSDEIIKIKQEGFDVSSLIVIRITISTTIGIILIVFLFNFFRWRKTYIYIKDDNIVVDYDFIINKRKTTVKLSSISTVNFQQGILERIFNTYKLQIDINSFATAEKTDFNLIFSQSVAEEFKKELTQDFSQKNQIQENKTVDEIKPIFEFTTNRVLKHGLLSISVGGVLFSTIIFVFALISQFTDTFASDNSNPITTVIAILFFVGPVIWHSISPFIRYQNFKIGKLGNRVIISYGLITKRQFNLPLNKTNAVVIKQPFLARLCHLYYGELINIGMGDEEDHHAPIFCLLVNKQELDFILNEINPNFVISDMGEKSPKSAFIPVSLPYILLGIISVVVSSLLGYWWIGVIVLIFLLLCAISSHKTKALNILDDRIVITTGIFMCRTIIVPFGKIQNISAKSGPISRHFGISKGNANILASLVNVSNKIGYFPKDRFEKLFEKMIEFDSVLS